MPKKIYFWSDISKEALSLIRLAEELNLDVEVLSASPGDPIRAQIGTGITRPYVGSREVERLFFHVAADAGYENEPLKMLVHPVLEFEVSPDATGGIVQALHEAVEKAVREYDIGNLITVRFVLDEKTVLVNAKSELGALRARWYDSSAGDTIGPRATSEVRHHVLEFEA